MQNNINCLKIITRYNILRALLLPLFLGLVSSGLLFIDEFDLRLKEIVNIGNRSVETVDRELLVRMQSLKALQLECDQYLAYLTVLTWNPVTHLTPLPEKDSYALKPIKEYEKLSLGEITGIGQIPAANSRAAEEMGMAVSLTPIFKAIVERDPDTPWVYYTSANGFIYIYPKAPPEEFCFIPEIFNAQFYQGITPSLNPNRNIYWTPKYLDLAGKGYMVTVSAPVYKDNTFLGGLSIDLSLEKLSWLLERYEYPYSTSYLVDSNGDLLIDTPGLATNFDYMKMPSGVPKRYGDYYITRMQLNNNWSIIIQTSYKSLVLASLNKALSWGFVISLLVFCGILIFQLKQSVKKIAALSTIDSLTGLFNRRQYDMIASLVFDNLSKRTENIAFLMYDLDDFKKLNDTYGHQKGDTVLTLVSQTVRNLLKHKSDYIFRIGGEEFIIIAMMPDNDIQNLADYICKTVYDLQLPNETAKIPYVTISIGGVLIAKDKHLSHEEAYKVADQALYQAKSNGKNQANIVYITK